MITQPFAIVNKILKRHSIRSQTEKMVNILYGFVLHIYPGIDVIQAELPRDDDDGAEHFMDSHVGGLRITTKVEFRGDGWRPVSLTCKHVIYYKTVQVTQRLIKKYAFEIISQQK